MLLQFLNHKAFVWLTASSLEWVKWPRGEMKNFSIKEKHRKGDKQLKVIILFLYHIMFFAKIDRENTPSPGHFRQLCCTLFFSYQNSLFNIITPHDQKNFQYFGQIWLFPVLSPAHFDQNIFSLKTIRNSKYSKFEIFEIS